MVAHITATVQGQDAEFTSTDPSTEPRSAEDREERSTKA